MEEIRLAPLAHEDVSQLIVDSLYCGRERAASLAQLMLEKTDGNPFFVIQFLSAMVEEGLLTFDHGEGRWSWDLTRIHAKGYTDNVVDLMVGKLSRLPIATQEVLQQFACLGNSAERALLAMVCEGSKEALDRDLDEALRAGLVLPSGDSYRFLHDRVQEAAYSQIPEATRVETHLRIGRLLAAHTPPDKQEETIFEIVNQLNRGAALMTSRDETERLAQFNLIAGRRAKASTAYVSALNYLVAGAALLRDDGWERRPDLMLPLELHRAECELLTGELAAAEERLTMLVSRAITFHRSSDGRLLAHRSVHDDRPERSRAGCLSGLHALSGHRVVARSRQKPRHGGNTIACGHSSKAARSRTLIDLPVMSDAAVVATLDVLSKALPPAVYTNANLLCLLVCQMITLSVEHGNTDGSCLAYVWMGANRRISLWQLRRRVSGSGGLGTTWSSGRAWSASKPAPTSRSATTACHGSHTCEPRARCSVAHSTPRTETATSRLQPSASTTSSRTCLRRVTRWSMCNARPSVASRLPRSAGFRAVIDLLTTQLGLIRTLRGLTATFGSFNDAHFDELQYERSLSSGPAPGAPIAACRYWIRKLQARFFAGDHVAAVDASAHVQRLQWTTPSVLELADFHFYGALSHAACCDAVSPAQ